MPLRFDACSKVHPPGNDRIKWTMPSTKSISPFHKSSLRALQKFTANYNARDSSSETVLSTFEQNAVNQKPSLSQKNGV